MPVTSFRNSAAAPAAPAAAPTPQAMPDEAVGHGTTRLLARPHAWPGAQTLPFIPGTPPPRGETAGAHGAHKGRISVRYWE